MGEHAEEAESLDDLATRRYLVFYTQLQNGNPAYNLNGGLARPADDEVERHIRQIIWLSLYFDHIIFYADDLLSIPFQAPIDVAFGVISSSVFEKFLDKNIIKFCGRRKRTRQDMAQLAFESSKFLMDKKRKKYDDLLWSLFERPGSFLNRSLYPIDRSYAKFFSDFYHNLFNIKEGYASYTEKHLIDITCNSAADMGYVSFADFFHEIKTDYPSFPDDILIKYFTTYFLAHLQNSRQEHPDVYIFDEVPRLVQSPGIDFIQPKLQKPVPSLVAPKTFKLFLNLFLDEWLMSQLIWLARSEPEVIPNLRDADWLAFRAQYHRILIAADASFKAQREVWWDDDFTDVRRIRQSALEPESLEHVRRVGRLIRNSLDTVGVGKAVDSIGSLAEVLSPGARSATRREQLYTAGKQLGPFLVKLYRRITIQK